MRLTDEHTLHRQYDERRDTFFRAGYSWMMYEAPNSIRGPVYITNALQNDPYGRSQVSKQLGVRIEPIDRIAYSLRLPDGTQVKANWFDENFIVLADREHKTAIALSPTDGLSWGKSHAANLVYASPAARPNGRYPIYAHLPDIKAGNTAIKELEPYVGEARLRAGILSLNASHDAFAHDVIRNWLETKVLDMTDAKNVRALLNPKLNELIRKYTRRKLVLKELVYEP